MAEMQRILLKSKKMKTFFETHKKERELILVKLNKISKLLKKHEITIPKTIPPYLIPSFLKRKDLKDSIFVEEEPEKPQQETSGENPANEQTVIENKDSEVIERKRYQNPTLSSHKAWKIKHGKTKKWDDKKKIQKGIYN